MTKLEWKQVKREPDGSDIVTWRAKVPGGWLVSVWAAMPQANAGGKAPVPGGSNWGGGITFLPEKAGELWDVAHEPPTIPPPPPDPDDSHSDDRRPARYSNGTG